MLKERYDNLTIDRQQFLQRARHNAMLTIPSLMPLEGHDGKSHLVEPYQSLGAMGVVSLSSRVTMALIPAGRPHLRLDIPPRQLLEMQGEIPAEIEQNLSKSERLVQHAVERANWRNATLESQQQLIVTGSVTEEFLLDNTVRLHRLDHFVWRRDERGVVIEAVIMEAWDRAALPEGVSAQSTAAQGVPGRSGSSEDDVWIYTGVRLMTDGTYRVWKENEFGDTVPDSMQEYAPEMLPFSFLTWSMTPGEDYGRSKIEEHVADLRSLDSLSKQALEQGAMAAMNFVMIRPGAAAQGVRNRIKNLSNGEVVLGDPEGVELKQFTNSAGYQVTADSIQRLEERLGRGFLMLNPGQRNAERVTATEIRRDIEELESVLGGTFSNQALMLERRTVLLLENMKAMGEFPQVDKGALSPTILTGLEALSRERDVERGIQAAQIVAQFGEQGMMHIKFPVVLNKIMIGLGFADAVKSEREVQKEMQQQQQAQMLQAAGPGVAQELVKQQGGQ